MTDLVDPARAADGFRSGFVSLVGRPNAGKSTLTNALVGEKVAITSSKPQTTRHTIRGIVHREDFQLVLVDTTASAAAVRQTADRASATKRQTRRAPRWLSRSRAISRTLEPGRSRTMSSASRRER